MCGHQLLPVRSARAEQCGGCLPLPIAADTHSARTTTTRCPVCVCVCRARLFLLQSFCTFPLVHQAHAWARARAPTPLQSQSACPLRGGARGAGASTRTKGCSAAAAQDDISTSACVCVVRPSSACSLASFSSKGAPIALLCVPLARLRAAVRRRWPARLVPIVQRTTRTPIARDLRCAQCAARAHPPGLVKPAAARIHPQPSFPPLARSFARAHWLWLARRLAHRTSTILPIATNRIESRQAIRSVTGGGPGATVLLHLRALSFHLYDRSIIIVLSSSPYRCLALALTLSSWNRVGNNLQNLRPDKFAGAGRPARSSASVSLSLSSGPAQNYNASCF